MINYMKISSEKYPGTQWWRLSLRMTYLDTCFASVKWRLYCLGGHLSLPGGGIVARMGHCTEAPRSRGFPVYSGEATECEWLPSPIKATLQGFLQHEPFLGALASLWIAPSIPLRTTLSTSVETILLLSMTSVPRMVHMLNCLFLQITLCLDPGGE